ncbi:MAG: hypothetical protein A2073_05940 [Deltaproteobacteria bacterium GWC2_42_11]|nr:MAG: hypothetical protein A2073_05940 [Deltaproteobacteria bacterium GWC2_42_11]
MEIITIILLSVLIIIALWLVLNLRKPKEDNNSILLMQQQVDNLRQQLSENMASSLNLINQQLAQTTFQVNSQLSAMNQQLQSTTGHIGARLDNAVKVFGEVKQNLGELSKATQQIFDVGKDIAGLQEILRAPKLRGGIGELFLGDLLSQILPAANYKIQHTFKNGMRVDAIIQTNHGIVPVDSKFPLENFKRIVESSSEEECKTARKKFVSDVKKHIDAIASQYILPDEGTFDFALMYIPAENVYYETIIKDESIDTEKGIAAYAFSKRVVPVSPNSFYAYLQTILLGLRGMEISREAQEILSHLARLRNDFERFAEDFEVIGKHLGNTRNKYDEAQKKLDRLGDKLKGLGEGKESGVLGE